MGLNLLDLPVDILYLILRPLVVSRAPIPLCPCAGAPSDIRPLPVLLSHPAVHAVACPLLYEGNIFVLDVRGDHGPHVRRCLEEARAAAEDKDGEGRQGLATASDLDDDGEDDAMAAKRGPLLLQRGALRRMSRVEVRIAKLRAWLQSLAVPVLADMAMGGTLSELLVYVHDSSGAGHGRNNTRATAAAAAIRALGRPPLKGLLRVLGDPYVRQARLVWVSAAAGAGGAEAEAEVDWRAALREEDPDGRQLVVGLEPDVRAARGFSSAG